MMMFIDFKEKSLLLNHINNLWGYIFLVPRQSINIQWKSEISYAINSENFQWNFNNDEWPQINVNVIIRLITK